MWINTSCQWCSFWGLEWNRKFGGRCKGKKLSSLYLQIFIIVKKTQKHLAYFFLLFKRSHLLEVGVSVAPRLQHRHAESISTFQQMQLFCAARYGCRRQIQKQALPEATGEPTIKALITRQWVKVPFQCKTTKFNSNTKMCSNRMMCGDFRRSFFKQFLF